MNTEKMTEGKQEEKLTILKNVKQGTTIRFQHDTFETALTENLFYIVCQNKDKKVSLVCLANAEIIVRDEDWRVIEHESKLLVRENILTVV